MERAVVTPVDFAASFGNQHPGAESAAVFLDTFATWVEQGLADIVAVERELSAIVSAEDAVAEDGAAGGSSCRASCMSHALECQLGRASVWFLRSPPPLHLPPLISPRVLGLFACRRRSRNWCWGWWWGQ